MMMLSNRVFVDTNVLIRILVDDAGAEEQMKIARKLIADSGVNILDLIANISATEIAYDAGAGLTLGTGGGTAPTGIVTAASSAVAGGTGVGGAPTYENLVDLAYSVAGSNRASYGYMMNAQALAAVRKIKDGAGNNIGVESVVVKGE
jgi:HK97 family phage major capsid protein